MKLIEFDCERLSKGDIIHHNYNGLLRKLKFLGFHYIDEEKIIEVYDLRGKEIFTSMISVIEIIKDNLKIEKRLEQKIQKILKI